MMHEKEHFVPLPPILIECKHTREKSQIFGFYVAPTYDFIQELRKFGSTLEVLEPTHLRDEFKEESEKLKLMYERKSNKNASF